MVQGMSYPWPLTNREQYLSTIGTCLTDEKAVVVVLKSINGDNYLGKSITKNAKCVETEVHFIGIKLEVIDDENIQISFLMNLDPKLKNIP